VAGAILARYAFLFLVPVRMCSDYSADPVFRRDEIVSIASSGPVVAMAVATVVLVGVGLAARRRAPWLAFGILWFFVALLPVAQVVRIGAVMADRYLYVPSAGAAAALAAGVLALPRWRVPLGAALLACMAALTVGREAAWRSDLTMNRDVLRSYPGNADAWNRTALYWARRGDVRREEEAYRRGLALSPGNRFLRKNLGWLLHQRGEDRRAIEELGRAFTQPQPGDLAKAKIAYALARSMIAVGEEEGAAPVLEEAVLCRPPFAPAFELLGLLYRDRLHRPERGEALLRRAESIRRNAGIRAPKTR
jgi:Flp pilus assembly protein TadD